MNQKNLEFLRDQIKYTGFGDTLENALKENLLKGEKEFQLNHEVSYGSDKLSTVLNFKKSDESDLYFFNTYKAILQKDQSKESLEQTFFINQKGGSVTMKEAYNLMEGRSVNKDFKTKEGEDYNCWIKIDFKTTEDNGNFKINHYHQNYGYDLEASLAKYAIKELNTPSYKEDLINSLKKGNLQSVTVVIDGSDKKQYIEANPHYKTINIYDTAMQRINPRESRVQKQDDNEGKSVSINRKQNDAAEVGLEEKKVNSKSKKKASHL